LLQCPAGLWCLTFNSSSRESWALCFMLLMCPICPSCNLWVSYLNIIITNNYLKDSEKWSITGLDNINVLQKRSAMNPVQRRMATDFVGAKDLTCVKSVRLFSTFYIYLLNEPCFIDLHYRIIGFVRKYVSLILFVAITTRSLKHDISLFLFFCFYYSVVWTCILIIHKQ